MAGLVYCERSGLNPEQAVETSKLEYGRGGGNSRWSGEMHRYREEHQRRKHSAGPTTDTDRRKLGERMGLDTPVVLAVNDGH